MSDVHIHILEKRPEWPAIVCSVVCKTCGAQPGDFCTTGRPGANPLLHGGQTRSDFHAIRKYDAAEEWVKSQSVPAPEEPAKGKKK